MNSEQMSTETANKDEIFTNWVNSYSDKLYSWAFHKTSNKEIAEDIVQETFLSAYKSFDKFEEKSTVYTWLSSILNNKIIDYYKQSSKTFVFVDTTESKQAFSNSEEIFTENEDWKNPNEPLLNSNDNQLLDNEEFVLTMENCYDKLPSNWKKAVQAKYILNVDSSQICQELSITPSNYWKVIQRSKLLLKQCIEINWFK